MGSDAKLKTFICCTGLSCVLMTCLEHAAHAVRNTHRQRRTMSEWQRVACLRYPRYCGYSRGFLVDRSLRGVPFVSLCRTAAMPERCPKRRSNKDTDHASTGTDNPSVSWLEDGASTLRCAPKISMETKSHGRPARLMPCACRMLPDSWRMAHESATVRPLYLHVAVMRNFEEAHPRRALGAQALKDHPVCSATQSGAQRVTSACIRRGDSGTAAGRLKGLAVATDSTVRTRSSLFGSPAA